MGKRNRGIGWVVLLCAIWGLYEVWSPGRFNIAGVQPRAVMALSRSVAPPHTEWTHDIKVTTVRTAKARAVPIQAMS